MLDVFTEEIEVIIKDGIANLYWFKNDLKRLGYVVGSKHRLAINCFKAEMKKEDLVPKDN